MEKEITISKYINGELSGSALAEFEDLLKKDKDLLAEVEFHKKVDKALISYEEVESNENLKSLLTDLGKTHIQDKSDETIETTAQARETEIIANPEILSENKSKLKKLYPYLLLPAAASLLLFLFLPVLQKKSNQEIAENNFQLYELDNKLGDNTPENCDNAVRNYAKGNFKEANDQFRVCAQVPKDWLAKGCAEFKLGNINDALISFAKVIEVDESEIYYPTAYWYMALCFLKKDKPEKAVIQLKEIKEGADYYTEAKRLLRQIK